MNMKAVIIVLALGLITCTGLDAHSPHDVVHSVCVSPDYKADHTLFCSIDYLSKFLVKSTDGGITWTPSHVGLPYSRINCMVMSPVFHLDGIMFVGIRHGKIFKTTDHGATWTDSSSGLSGMIVTALAVSPDYQYDQTVFCAIRHVGLFKSVDGGVTWVPHIVNLPSKIVNSIAVSPTYGQDQTIFVGTENGIHKSDDGGQNWFNPLDSNLTGFSVTSLAISPDFSTDQIVFAGVHDWGLFESMDGGKTWCARNNGITDYRINSIGLSPDFVQDRTVFIATREAGVFVSKDGGNVFGSLNKGLDSQASQTDNHYFQIAFSPNFKIDHTVFLGAWEGLHRLDSNMTAWRHLDLFGGNMVRDLALSPDFSTDGILFAAAYGGGIYRTEDVGDTWLAINTGLEWMCPAALALSPDFGQDDTIFTGIWTDVMKSTMRGDMWTGLEAANEWFYCKTLALSPALGTDGTLFAGNGELAVHTVYKSTDGGNSFIPFDVGHSMITHLVLSPEYPTDQTLFVSSKEGIFRSVDGGLNWTNMFDDYLVLTLAVSPEFAADGLVVAGTAMQGLYVSHDYGISWSSLPTDIGSDVFRDIAISPDFANDQTLFVAGKSSGIHKSIDGGQTWVQSGLVGEFILCMALSPDFASDGTAFAGGWRGVYRSRDSGTTWSQVLNIRCYDEGNEFVTLNGDWNIRWDQSAIGRRLSYSDTASDFAQLIFLGTSIKVVGARAPSGGIASVYLDGLCVTDVDLYSPQPEWQAELFSTGGLPYGEHTLRIEVAGTKNPVSSGCFVFVDAFEVGGI